MTNDIITQIESVLAAATAGEWRVSDKHGLCVVVDGEDPDMIADMSPEGSPWTGDREDAALIVLLRNNASDLLRLARAGLDAYDEQTEIVGKLSDDLEKVTGERDRLKTNFSRMQKERDEARAKLETLSNSALRREQGLIDKILSDEIARRGRDEEVEAERDEARLLLDEAFTIINDHLPGYTVWLDKALAVLAPTNE